MEQCQKCNYGYNCSSCPDLQAKAEAEAEAPYHFYAATCMNWATALTRRAAIAKVAQAAGKDVIRLQNKEFGGMYVWSVKVLTPQDADYNIRNFAPVDVPMEAAAEHRITDAKGSVVVLD